MPQGLKGLQARKTSRPEVSPGLKSVQAQRAPRPKWQGRVGQEQGNGEWGEGMWSKESEARASKAWLKGEEQEDSDQIPSFIIIIQTFTIFFQERQLFYG